jgi:hypothetical protein
MSQWPRTTTTIDASRRKSTYRSRLDEVWRANVLGERVLERMVRVSGPEGPEDIRRSPQKPLGATRKALSGYSMPCSTA